jgi:hypothetical protein
MIFPYIPRLYERGLKLKWSKIILIVLVSSIVAFLIVMVICLYVGRL